MPNRLIIDPAVIDPSARPRSNLDGSMEACSSEFRSYPPLLHFRPVGDLGDNALVLAHVIVAALTWEGCDRDEPGRSAWLTADTGRDPGVITQLGLHTAMDRLTAAGHLHPTDRITDARRVRPARYTSPDSHDALGSPAA